ncbi:alkaline phosphatase D family protein [Streptomyces xiamenensis]
MPAGHGMSAPGALISMTRISEDFSAHLRAAVRSRGRRCPRRRDQPASRPGRAGPLAMDAWDGYPWARARLPRTVRESGVRTLVVFTGDVHVHHGFDIGEEFEDPASPDDRCGTGHHIDLQRRARDPAAGRPGGEDDGRSASALLRRPAR